MYEKEQCDALLNALLPAVQHLLERYREFYPAGAVLRADGTVALTGTFDGNEHPESQAVIQSLVEAHRQAAVQDGILASGIAYNVAVTSGGKKTDAILIRMEHRDGYSVTVGVPYTVGFFKKIKYGELFTMPGEHEVFDEGNTD